jgi:hypothetical protein
VVSIGVADRVWLWLGVPLVVLFATILLQRLEAALLTGPEAGRSPSEAAAGTPSSPVPDPSPAPSRAPA